MKKEEKESRSNGTNKGERSYLDFPSDVMYAQGIAKHLRRNEMSKRRITSFIFLIWKTSFKNLVSFFTKIMQIKVITRRDKNQKACFLRFV